MAIRNLNRNIGRTSMTSVILCLGIAMIVLMSSLNSAILQSYERVIHNSYGGNLDIMFHHIEKEDLRQDQKYRRCCRCSYLFLARDRMEYGRRKTDAPNIWSRGGMD